MAVSAVACTYQWAETTRIGGGRGTDRPKARQASVYRLRSRAFIGLPWPKNAAGMTLMEPPPVVPTSVIISPHPADGEINWMARCGAGPVAAGARRAPRLRPRHRG